MNTIIEVAAAEVNSLMLSATVIVHEIIYKVVSIVSAVATLVMFNLRQGSTSLNAVSPVNTFEGGLAVA